MGLARLCSGGLSPVVYYPTMPFTLPLDEAAVLPLRGILFQCLLLLVAIVLEAIVLRRQLQLGYQPSIQYAATLNLLAVVVGWVIFLGIEPLLPEALRMQIISYVLFDSFFVNTWASSLGVAIIVTGLIIFFLTFWVKGTALEWLTWALGNPIVERRPRQNANRFRYRRSPTDSPDTLPHLLAVLQANALSFTAVLVLLLLRYGVS